jgi:hypothetical protein
LARVDALAYSKQQEDFTRKCQNYKKSFSMNSSSETFMNPLMLISAMACSMAQTTRLVNTLRHPPA